MEKLAVKNTSGVKLRGVANHKNIGEHTQGGCTYDFTVEYTVQTGGVHPYIIYRCLHTPMQACTHPYVVRRYAYASPTHRSGHTCTAREEVKMKFGNNLNYDFLNAAKYMPVLRHKEINMQFDIRKSEAAKWICSQPEVLQKIFDMARRKGLIEYDSETNTWKGVDYHD